VRPCKLRTTKALKRASSLV